MPGVILSKSDQDGLLSKYKCVSCKLLLRDAMQTSCGHFYCLSCLDNLVVPDARISSIKCLEDSTIVILEEVFPDNFMRREIMQLVVQCTYVESGCKWKGEVLSHEMHTKTCKFLQVPCIHSECGMLVKKSDLKEHLEKECKCRLHMCNYCKKEVKLNLMQIHHNNDCPGYPTICPKCSKDGVPRAKMTEHQDPLFGDCDGVQGPCPFAEAGCSEKKVMSRSQKDKHLQEYLLKMALNVSRDVESLMHRTPGLVSRNPSFMTDYENVISDILARVQGTGGDHREVREIVQNQSERITILERGMATMRISAGTVSPITDESGGSGLPANQVTRRAIGPENPIQDREMTEMIRQLDERITALEMRYFNLRGANQPYFLPGDLGSNMSEQVWPDPPADGLIRRIRNLENRTADHEVLLVENNRNVDDLSQQINSLNRQLEAAMETVRRLERKVESHEHVLAIRNVALADLEEFVRQQQVSSYDGALLWKIPDYARKKNDAVSGRQTSFYSACFYTSRHGYKMCARLYLNGDGMGKGTHISVFFTVMRGQYDALLRWPFRQKVTIMLLDQDNVEHVIDAFRPDPNSSSFQRPRREMNVASGCPLFCALSELNKHAYVRDDVMFMKIIVDTSDL